MLAKEHAMTIELTEEQLTAVKTGGPLRLDAAGTELVVIRAEIFDRLQTLADEADPEGMYPLLAEIAPEDWEDASPYGIGQ
jgi:hypothetical protein